MRKGNIFKDAPIILESKALEESLKSLLIQEIDAFFACVQYQSPPYLLQIAVSGKEPQKPESKSSPQ